MLERVGAGEWPTCKRCGAFLHSFASTCFGCDTERGSAYSSLVAKEILVRKFPVADILALPAIAEAIRDNGHILPAAETEARQFLWSIARMTPAPRPWPIPGQRVNYVGGLESH